MFYYYLIKTTKDTIGMFKIPDRYFFGSVRCHQSHDGLTFVKISETEYTSYEALELFTVFEYIPRSSKDILPQMSNTHVDFYDPNFYEAVEHKGTKRIVERMDRRFLAKGT